MSDNIVEITDNSRYSIEISTSLEANNNLNIELSDSSSSSVDVINNSTVLVGDLPQGYPLNWTVGNLPVTRVSGLVGQSGINYNSGIISLSGIPSQFLPVQNLIAGSGINVSNNNGIFNIAVTGQFGLTGEQVDDRVSNLLVAGSYINLNYNDLADSLTVSVTGLQPSGDYSIIGHSHNSSDINNFNTSVDQRISLANLQPSGNYSVVGHGHIISDISGLQLSLDSKQPIGNYSLIGHIHTSSDITNFTSAASGAAPVQSVAGRIGNIILNKNDVGLNNVNNTSDLDKPVSIAQALADSNIQNIAAADAATKASNAQAYAIQRSNHTGTQAISTINGLQTALDNKQPSGNYATLVNGTIPSSQLPSYVDDVLEYSNVASLPASGEAGKIYTTLNNNKIYRWSGSSYIEISASPGSTDSVPEGSINKYYTDARASGAAPVQSVAGKIGAVVLKSSDITISSNYVGSPTIYANDALDAVLVNLDTQLENCITVDQFHSESSYATSTVPGVVKIGSGVAINSGVISVSTNYASPTHIHGNITNDGKIGSLSGQLVITTTSGLLTTISGIPSSQITDFASGVSGLLPVKNITSGSGISISSTSGTYTVAVTGNFGLTSEEVDDRVSSLLSAGTGIVLNYDDPNNILTISTSGLAFTSGANFNSLSVTGVPVSISGHKHLYTDITNFSSGVQDNLTTTLLPGSFININYDSTLDTLTVSTSGLQPSGNYSVVGHSHLVSDITNFGSGVSGLLPVKNVVGSGYVNVVNTTGNYTISVTGLQPSGNYSLAGHTHTSSQITDFNTAASLASPVQSVAGRSGVVTLTKSDVGLSNIDNTSDLNKPVSTAQASADSAVQAYSIQRSNHTGTQSSSTISDFNSSVSGLLPVKNIVGSGYINVVNATGNYTINVTGLQPSGIYASGIHSHGNISSSGTIGSVSGQIVVTTSNGLLTTTNTIPATSIENYGTFSIIYLNGNSLLPIYADGSRIIINETIHAYGDKADFNAPITFLNDEFGTIRTQTRANLGLGTASISNNTDFVPNLFINNPIITFTHPDGSYDGSYDTIIPGQLVITRGNGGAIYNLALEQSWNGSTPADTLWNADGWSNLNNISSRGYVNFYDLSGGNLGYYLPNVELIMKHVPSNRYWKVKFTSWTQGGAGGFVYTRQELTNININNSLNIGDSSTNLPGRLNIFGSGIISSGLVLNDQTSNTIAGFDSNKKIVSLNTATYPSLTELSYVKGISSSLQTQLNSKQPSGNYALSSHTHTASQITDFNTSVSGLISGTYQPLLTNPVTGTGTSGYLSRFGSTSGLTNSIVFQSGNGIGINTTTPSGQLHVVGSGIFSSGLFVNTIPVSVSGHSHSSSDISNFNSSVSGLLPVTNITAGTNISISSSSGNFTINSTAAGGGGATISNSGLNRLLTSDGSTSGIVGQTNMTFNGSLLNVSGSGNFTSGVFVSGIPLGEVIDDEVAGLLIAGTGINLSYNDNNNTLTVRTDTNTINSTNLYLWANFR